MMRLLVLAPAVFGMQKYCRLSKLGKGAKCTVIDFEHKYCVDWAKESDCDKLKTQLKRLYKGEHWTQEMNFLEGGPQQCRFEMLVDWLLRSFNDKAFAMDCTPITTTTTSTTTMDVVPTPRCRSSRGCT